MTTQGPDLAGADLSLRPQDDLFSFVNGSWIASTPIPPDRPLAATIVDLLDEADLALRALAEEAASAPEGSEERKVAHLYQDFLDTPRLDALGLTPICPTLEAVLTLSSFSDLSRLLGSLTRTGLTPPFHLEVDSDARDSSTSTLYLSQAGLSLPDRDYYLEDSFSSLRSTFSSHVEQMLSRAAHPDPSAASSRILALETSLATSSWDRVTSRDALLTYNPTSRTSLASLLAPLDLAAFEDGLGHTLPDSLVLREDSFFSVFSSLEDLAAWKDWLFWRVLSTAAPLLDSTTAELSFSFFGTVLTGTQEDRPRWKRSLALLNSTLGFALGRLYVQRHFPPTSKALMLSLVENLITAYQEQISSLSWMSPPTRARALEKLDTILVKIGYPDTWRDYSSLTILPGDLLGNVHRARAFDLDRTFARIGHPVDKAEWLMVPQEVNAYYNPSTNEVAFPAAILQPPFFSPTADPAVNYGAIGAVIGHELGHAFDDQGSKYDASGNLAEWWTPKDKAAFRALSARLSQQFDSLTPSFTPEDHVQGEFTLGENIGDLAGLCVALEAYLLTHPDLAPLEDSPFTALQRFFLSWARAWRGKYRPEDALRRLRVDPHAPCDLRANTVRNLDAFHTAFQTSPGDALWLPPEDRVRIW